MEALSVKGCLAFAIRTFRSRPWIFVQAGLLLLLINVGLSLAQGTLERSADALAQPSASVLMLVSAIAGMLVSFLISMGETAFFLGAHDDADKAELKDLWHPHPFWKFVVVTVLSGIAIFLGLILLIVPGVIAAILFMFVGYLTIEEGLSPIDAMKKSIALTKGSRWTLFWLSLALLGINLLGLLALVVGLFVTIPISFLASVHAYRTLQARASAPAPEAVPLTAAA